MATANVRARLGLDSMPYRAGARQVSRQNEAMRRSIMQVGAAIGVSFGIAGIVRAGRALMDYASQASIAARNTGLLTHEFMALNRVGIQAGVQTRQMEQLLSRLQNELFQAAQGSEAAARKFEQMGLSVDDLVKMRPADMLEAVSKAAFETGIPIGNLADLFGQRLGPQAVTALREIAENGLPNVDAAVGVTADKTEALGSQWEAMLDTWKAWGLTALHWVNEVHLVMVDFADGALANIQGRFEAIGLLMRGRFRDAIAMDRALREQGVIGGAMESVGAGREHRERALEQAINRRTSEQQRGIEQMGQLREQTQREAEEKSTAAAETRIKTTEENEREANERMIRQRMEGEERIEADYMTQKQDAIRAMYEAESESVKQLFAERVELLDRFYAEDLKAHRDAEAEKLSREEERQQEAINRMNERMERERDQASGTGIMADQLARVGGFMGGERAGMAQSDKQLRVAELSEAHLREIASSIAAIESTETRGSGGGI